MALISIADTADRLHVDKTAVSSWIQAGHLRVVRHIGNFAYLDEDDVAEFQTRLVDGRLPRSSDGYSVTKLNDARKQQQKAWELGMFCVANNIKKSDLHQLVWERNELYRKKGLE